VSLVVAAGIVSAIGDISRGLGAAHHGCRSHARAMLIEAAWIAAKAPGPLHAFFVRIRGRSGQQSRGSQARCALLATRPARCNFKPDIRNRRPAGVHLKSGSSRPTIQRRTQSVLAVDTSTLCNEQEARLSGIRQLGADGVAPSR
jgi:hypothetical protein